MDTLLASYLDGELGDEEARVLLQRLESDSQLAAELRDYERILSGAQLLRNATAPEGFTDVVMARIADSASEDELAVPAGTTGPRTRWRAWRPALAVAAVLVLAFVLGRVTVRTPQSTLQDAIPPSTFSQGHSTLNVGEQPRPEVASLVSAGRPTPSSGFRIVRLLYAPTRSDLASVSVAGSFNGWNAHSLPLQRVGEVWTTTLVLPPGAYEYMFVEDGKRWVTDPLAPYTRDDGFGNRNAVLDLGA